MTRKIWNAAGALVAFASLAACSKEDERGPNTHTSFMAFCAGKRVSTESCERMWPSAHLIRKIGDEKGIYCDEPYLSYAGDYNGTRKIKPGCEDVIPLLPQEYYQQGRR